MQPSKPRVSGTFHHCSFMHHHNDHLLMIAERAASRHNDLISDLNVYRCFSFWRLETVKSLMVHEKQLSALKGN